MSASTLILIGIICALIGGYITAKIALYLGAMWDKERREYEDVRVNAAEFRAKYEVTQEWAVAVARKAQLTDQMNYDLMGAFINKLNNPLPYTNPQTSQNSHYTAESIPTNQLQVNRGGEDSAKIKLIFRGGLQPNDVTTDVDGLNYQGYKVPMPMIHQDSVQFGNTGVYAGGCKCCSNRFVSKQKAAEYCSDSCKTEFNNKNR